jgi:RHS repeat-associated protein
VNRAPGGVINSRFDYTYDDLGRRTDMTTLDGRWTYEYDALGQLTHAVFSSSNSTVPNQDLRYEYDAAGNRVRTVSNGKATGYAVNSLDQYTAVGTARYSYDPDGNLIETVDGPNASTYTYNDQDQLIRVTTPDGTWNYEYDPLGNRVAQVHNGQRTEYLLDPTGLSNVFGEYDGSGGLVARYAQGLGLAARVGADGQPAFYDFDGTGSTAGLSGGDGRYVDAYSYLPFGEALAAPRQTVSNPFTYVGQSGVMQEGNGLDFMRARYYAPADGRFVSEDPIRFQGGVNLYRYAGNQPTGLIDPSGNDDLLADPSGSSVGRLGLEQEFEQIGLKEFTQYEELALAEKAQEAAKALIRSVDMGEIPEGYVIQSGKGRAKDLALEALKNLGKKLPSGGLLALKLLGKAFAIYSAIDTGWDIGYNIIGNGIILRFFPEVGTFYGNALADFLFGKNPGPLASGSTGVLRSFDPNDLLAPAGFGDKHFVAREQSLDYTVHFENLATATAPAQKVVVTQQLDPNLDFTSFEVGDFGFGDFGFGDTVIHAPAGRNSFQTRIDARKTLGVFVDVTVDINPVTGLATWTFTSADPTTFDLPEDPLVGFLPPNKTAPQGEGFVSYRVRPHRADTTGTRIGAKATVVFDSNPPIDTPASFNTIDAGDPTSSVTPLPAVVNSTSFTVAWPGQDDAGGSGIAFFDVFVSDNGSPFTPLLQSTTQTSTTFTGVVGHTYGFYSVATDNVGHREATPAGAQATTLVSTAAIGGTDNLTGTGGVSGTVFQDFNTYGVQDPGEPGLAGLTITLTSTNNQGAPVTLSQPTDGNGHFQFTALTPGTYTLRQVLPGGVLLSTPASGSYQVTVTGGANLTGQNFGEVFTSSIVPLTLPPATPFPAHGDAHADFVEAVYRTVLGRNADAAGLVVWTGLFKSGALSRLQVVQGIWNSPEHFTQEVERFYVTLLGRPADANGLSFWVGQMEKGVREEQVAFAFLDSPEYLSHGDKFAVDSMYLSLLGRPFDAAGEAFWLGQLGDNASGKRVRSATLTHEQMILDFLFSRESLTRLTEGYYLVSLQRQADGRDFNSWLGRLSGGGTFGKSPRVPATGPALLDHGSALHRFRRVLHSRRRRTVKGKIDVKLCFRKEFEPLCRALALPAWGRQRLLHPGFGGSLGVNRFQGRGCLLRQGLIFGVARQTLPKFEECGERLAGFGAYVSQAEHGSLSRARAGYVLQGRRQDWQHFFGLALDLPDRAGGIDADLRIGILQRLVQHGQGILRLRAEIPKGLRRKHARVLTTLLQGVHQHGQGIRGVRANKAQRPQSVLAIPVFLIGSHLQNEGSQLFRCWPDVTQGEHRGPALLASFGVLEDLREDLPVNFPQGLCGSQVRRPLARHRLAKGRHCGFRLWTKLADRLRCLDGLLLVLGFERLDPLAQGLAIGDRVGLCLFLGAFNQVAQLLDQDLFARRPHIDFANDSLRIDQEQRRPCFDTPARGKGAVAIAFLE